MFTSPCDLGKADTTRGRSAFCYRLRSLVIHCWRTWCGQDHVQDRQRCSTTKTQQRVGTRRSWQDGGRETAAAARQAWGALARSNLVKRQVGLATRLSRGCSRRGGGDGRPGNARARTAPTLEPVPARHALSLFAPAYRPPRVGRPPRAFSAQRNISLCHL